MTLEVMKNELRRHAILKEIAPEHYQKEMEKEKREKTASDTEKEKISELLEDPKIR